MNGESSTNIHARQRVKLGLHRTVCDTALPRALRLDPKGACPAGQGTHTDTRRAESTHCCGRNQQEAVCARLPSVKRNSGRQTQRAPRSSAKEPLVAPHCFQGKPPLPHTSDHLPSRARVCRQPGPEEPGPLARFSLSPSGSCSMGSHSCQEICRRLRKELVTVGPVSTVWMLLRRPCVVCYLIPGPQGSVSFTVIGELQDKTHALCSQGFI